MAGPKEEWFIWDGRFQFGFSCLNKRLEINEEAVQRILQLDHQTEQLAASSKQLQEDNGVLRDRIQQLEQASHQITQLDEQIQDLTASCTQLKEENNGLNDKILQLEQESSYQDQKNGLLQGKLKEKLSVQEEGLKSVFVAMEGMNETARAERGQRGEEIQHLRSQVEALAATRHTPGEHARDGKSREPVTRSRFTNMRHSIKGNISDKYRGRSDAHQPTCQAPATAQRCSARHRGPRRPHTGSSLLHAL